MMGSQGAPASAIDELKNLLGLASDPARLQAALDQLKSQRSALDQSIQKNGELAAAAEAKIKAAEAKMVELQSKADAMAAREGSLAAKELAFDARSRELRAKEELLQNDRQAFDIMLAKSNKDIADKKASAEKELVVAAKASSDAMILKEEYETKLAKIKAAMG